MYRLSRLYLVLSVFAALGYIGSAVKEGWPLSGILLGLVALGRIGRRSGRLTTLGSARWAETDDLRAAGMIDAPSGLILGRLAGPRRYHFSKAVAGLFRWDMTAAQAAAEFVAVIRRPRPPLVRLPNAIHTAVFSPSGGGKGVSLVIPWLMICPESCVVIDFKGENARLTADYRRKTFGHKVVLLDPYKVVTQTPDTFDPLTYIQKDSPLAIDACNELAKATVIRTGEEKEPHWNDAAEGWIAGVMATVVYYGLVLDGTRSLQTIREIFSSPQKLDMAIKLMVESTAWDGILARMGGNLTHFIDKERSSTLTTASRHLRFLDSPAIVASTKRSSFDPAELRSGKITIYLVLPPDQMKSQSPLLRMWIGSLLRAVVSGGLQEHNKVHFILDEAASLGHLEAIDDAVDKYRGYGIRLQFYFQSMGQLKKCFPEGQDQTLLSNCTQVFFGVNDQALGPAGGTADYVSARLGEKTIIVDSGGLSTSRSYQYSRGTQHNSSYSSSHNRNWNLQTRKLLKPEEVIALPPRTAITFTPGVPPICTTLLRYYEERRLGMGPTFPYRVYLACSTLVLSVFAGASLVWMAYVGALLVQGMFSPRPTAPTDPQSVSSSPIPMASQATGQDAPPTSAEALPFPTPSQTTRQIPLRAQRNQTEPLKNDRPGVPVE